MRQAPIDDPGAPSSWLARLAIVGGALMVSEQLNALDEVQYCSLVDFLTLDPVEGEIMRNAAICVAAMVGKTRLIDNVLLSPSSEGIQLLSRLE